MRPHTKELVCFFERSEISFEKLRPRTNEVQISFLAVTELMPRFSKTQKTDSISWRVGLPARQDSDNDCSREPLGMHTPIYQRQQQPFRQKQMHKFTSILHKKLILHFPISTVSLCPRRVVII